jgi:hypothetical protein
MRLWVSDGNAKAYDPPILRKFFKALSKLPPWSPLASERLFAIQRQLNVAFTLLQDSTRDYPSIVTNTDVTACRAVPVPCREGGFDHD